MPEHAVSKGLAKSRRKVSRCRARVEKATVLTMRDPADGSPFATPLYNDVKIATDLVSCQARDGKDASLSCLVLAVARGELDRSDVAVFIANFNPKAAAR
jgi:hypothetical protein